MPDKNGSDTGAFDTPALAARGGEGNELRQFCPRDTLNVLDAVSMARNITRTELVNEILGNWAAGERHRASLIQRVAGINPAASEPVGGHA
jgi:hypothetical protein